MKKNKLLLLIALFLIPSIVFASNGSDEFPLGMALFMEAFVSIHMTIFVLWPLSNIFGGANPISLLKKLFIGRIIILLVCDIFISPMIAIADFLAVFIGAFLVVPICSAAKHKSPFPTGSKKVTTVFYKKEYKNGETSEFSHKYVNEDFDSRMKPEERKMVVRCSYCGRIAELDESTCDGCGAAFTEKDIIKDW